jgi:hypothetical protein
MSSIISSGEQISNSPLNNSTSKQMYSFPRANRFQQLNKSSSSNTFYYNLPSMIATRTTSLGKGGKYDFTKEHKGKNASFYNTPSDFDAKKPHSPAYSFGISRHYYDKVFYETTKMYDKNVPGPGKYDYLKPFGSNSLKFSIVGRPNKLNLSQSDKQPGPGQYPTIAINPSGKYPLSSFKNSSSIIFGQNNAKRFNYTCNLIYTLFINLIDDKNPGPDKYEIKSLIGSGGFIYQSNFKSPNAKSIFGKPKDSTAKMKSKIFYLSA